MTAVALDRLDLALELARQLGRQPTSNEVRKKVQCGRATANALLKELDSMDWSMCQGGSPLLPQSHEAEHETVRDLRQATGPLLAPDGGRVVSELRSSGSRRGPWGWLRLGPGPLPGQSSHPAGHPAPRVDSPAPVHRAWLLLLALPAFVAVWGGWVGLGGLAGFGPVHLLPGIADHFTVNLAVTLPAGMEVYSVIGLRVWLSGQTRTKRTRQFAMWSSVAALGVGCFGQVLYHVLTALNITHAPVGVVVFVACLPVAILGAGAGLFHLVGDDQRTKEHE